MFKLLLILLLSFFYLTTPAQALEQPTSLTVSPAMLELSLKPQETSTTTLTLINNSAIPLPIRAIANPLDTSFATTSPRFDASSWITITPADFILQPKSSKVINLKLTPPPDAQPGGHYATLIFEPLIPENLVATPQTLARVGSILLLSIPGSSTESLTLQALDFPPLSTSLPRDFTLQLHNTGTSHLLPTFNLTLRNSSGQEITSLPVNPSLILPEESKSYSFRWESIQNPGKYTVTGNITYGTQAQQIAIPITSIWFFPVWHFITIVILTLMTIWIIFRYKRVKLAIKILTSGNLTHDQTPAQKTNQ